MVLPLSARKALELADGSGLVLLSFEAGELKLCKAKEELENAKRISRNGYEL